MAHHWYQQHRWKIWNWWQIMGTISGCRDLKVNLKANMYLEVNSTTQRCPKKIIKTFMLEDFFNFHLSPMSTTPVVHLELRISPWIFEKIRNSPSGILRGWLETYSWKKPEVDISWHCPFKRSLPESILFLVAVSSLLASVSSPSLPIYADRISAQHEQRYYRSVQQHFKPRPLRRSKHVGLFFFLPKTAYFYFCLEWLSFVNTYCNMYCMWKENESLCSFITLVSYVTLLHSMLKESKPISIVAWCQDYSNWRKGRNPLYSVHHILAQHWDSRLRFFLVGKNVLVFPLQVLIMKIFRICLIFLKRGWKFFRDLGRF